LFVTEIDDLLGILDLASEYQIDGLISLCEGALIRCCDVDNACNLLLYAQQYSLTTLRIICVPLIARNLQDVRIVEEFEELHEDLKVEIKDWSLIVFK
jgi:hypothetical protein